MLFLFIGEDIGYLLKTKKIEYELIGEDFRIQKLKMQDHFIRYFPYHFDTNDPYYLGNSDITKSTNYNFNKMYYSISDDNFSPPKSDTKSFYDDYCWRSQTRNPYTSPNSNTRFQYQYFTDPVHVSPTTKRSDLCYSSDFNYHYRMSPSYTEENDFYSKSMNNYDITPCHHYQSTKYYGTTPSISFLLNQRNRNTDNSFDTTPSTDLTFNQHLDIPEFYKTTPSTNFTSKHRSISINSSKRRPSTDFTTKQHYQQPTESYSTTKFSREELNQQIIARQNAKYVKEHPNLIDKSVETIDESTHLMINRKINYAIPQNTPIIVTNFSTIDTAIYYHKKGFSKICVLNFADAIKVGGGYLNGRNAQEESLCRQTLLYPTLVQSTMHKQYRNDRNLYENDYMVYSPNVYVIRDNSNAMIEIPFKINIISAPAVDNRNHVRNADKIMERRIRKIVKLAAYKKNDVLVLGAFGCGVFKNNPNKISYLFKKVLISERLKDYFKLVVFPIYKNESCKKIFENALS